jgi:hypothetical protein
MDCQQPRYPPVMAMVEGARWIRAEKAAEMPLGYVMA